MNFLTLPRAQENAIPSWEKRAAAVSLPVLKETPKPKGGRPKVDKSKEIKKEHDDEVLAFIDTEPTKKDIYEYFRRKVAELNN